MPTIVVWEVTTGEQRLLIEDAEGWAQRIAWSPDGSWLATGDDADEMDATTAVRLWESETGAQGQVLSGHRGDIIGLTFAPDSSWLCSVDRAGVIRIWTVSGELCHTLSTGMRWPDVAIAPDGTWLAAHDMHGSVRVWDVATGAERFSLDGHTGSVLLAVGPESTWFATAECGDNASLAGVRLWDAQTGQLCGELPGHSGGVGALAVAPDGSWLVTGDDLDWRNRKGDRVARIWSVQATESSTLATQHLLYPVFDLAPDGSAVVFGGVGPLCLVDPATGTPRWTTNEDSEVYSVDFAPDGQTVITVTTQAIEIREAVNGALLQQFQQQEQGARWASVSPDGTWIVTWAYPTTIEDMNARRRYPARVLNLKDGTPRHTLDRNSETEVDVGRVVIAPDSSYIATSTMNVTRGRDNTVVWVWDSRNGRPRFALDGHRHGIGTIVISPCSRWLLTGESMMEDTEVTRAFLWDAASGESRHVLDGHAGAVTAAAIAPDARWLVTGDVAGTMRIWDLATGRCLSASHGRSPIEHIDVSPGGDWIAGCESRGGTGSVRIWESSTGTPVAEMRVDGPLYQCQWLPDGKGLCLSGTRGLYMFDLVILPAG